MRSVDGPSVARFVLSRQALRRYFRLKPIATNVVRLLRAQLESVDLTVAQWREGNQFLLEVGDMSSEPTERNLQSENARRLGDHYLKDVSYVKLYLAAPFGMWPSLPYVDGWRPKPGVALDNVQFVTSFWAFAVTFVLTLTVAQKSPRRGHAAPHLIDAW